MMDLLLWVSLLFYGGPLFNAFTTDHLSLSSIFGSLTTATFCS